MSEPTRHWIATLRPCADIPVALAPRVGLALRIASMRSRLEQNAPASAQLIADVDLQPKPALETQLPPPRRSPKKAVFAAVSLDDAASLLNAFGAAPESAPAPQSESMGPTE